MKRKQMGNGSGFTMGDALLLTPIFAKRKKDGEITLQGPQSITTNIKKAPGSFSLYTWLYVEQHHLEPTLAGVVMTDVFLTQSWATEHHGPALT